MEKLRASFNRPGLVVEIKVDEDKVIKNDLPKRKKILTPKEKYLLMLENNPLIKDLVDRFDLTLDET